MPKLEQLLKNLEYKISEHETINATISTVSVGWQIEHILLTINGVVDALQNPRTAYKWSFRLPRILVFGMNKIPRGKAKAPKKVQPKGSFDVMNIKKQFETARKNIQLLQTLDKNLYFEHPFLGHLKLKQTKKFLEIHTKHHLKIIDDITQIND